MRRVGRRFVSRVTLAAAIVAVALPGALASGASAAGSVAADSFSRTVSNAWGPADTGGSWTITGTPSNFSVAGGVAVMNQVTPGAGQSARLLGATAPGIDATIDVAISKPATGGGEYVALIGRRVTTNYEYRGRLHVAASGAMYAGVTRLAGSASDALVGSEVVVPGLTYSAGAIYRMRVMVTGASPTTISVKVWDASTSQPSAWNVTRTDSTAGLQTSGSVGVQTALSPSTTNAPVAFVFDNLNAVSTSGSTGPTTQLAAVDPTTDPNASHQTIVEPTTATAGNTIVVTYQAGRYAQQSSGAAAVGFATSTDGGQTWTSGILPGTSAASTPSAGYGRVVNMVVAHDDAHGQWIITTHGMLWNGSTWVYDAVLVSTSSDGLTWSLPQLVGQGLQPDKGWITCDNHPASPYFGHCYLLFSSQAFSRAFLATTSTDGGSTWSAPVATASTQLGYDVNPVVRPDGMVVVLATQSSLTKVVAFRSLDGGQSWTDPVLVANIQLHQLTATLRTRSKPSAAVDAAGRVYVTWYDCRFRASCTNNDIVWSRSDDGVTWTAPQRIAVDPTSSTVEHFVAAVGVTPGTSGANAQLTVTFYEMPNAACTSSTCLIDAVTTTSNDGGQTWAPVSKLNSTSMKVWWLAPTTLGRMLSDYDNIAYVGTKPVMGIVLANAMAGTTNQTFRQHLYFSTLL